MTKTNYVNVGGVQMDYGFVGTSEKLELLLADAKERSKTNEAWLESVAYYEVQLEIQKRREATTKKESK